MTANNDVENSGWQGFLTALKGLEEAAAPIQKHLKPSSAKSPVQDEKLMSRLPRVLYILHEHAVSFHDAFDKGVIVSIDGDISAADAFESDTSKQSFSTVHPLSVVVEVQSGKKCLVVRFTLMAQLNVLSVSTIQDRCKGVANAEAILVDLFPDDDGSNSPNLANAQWLPSQTTMWDKGLPGRPFKWAQWLGGLTFLRSAQSDSGSSSSTIPQEPFRMVVQLLRKRMATA